MMKIAIDALTFQPFGESALLIQWPASINLTILNETLAAKEILETNLKTPVQSIYHSLLITFSGSVDFPFEIERIKSWLQTPVSPRKAYTLWTLPVVYNSTYGVDIESLADSKKITVEELIQRHAQTEYVVYGIGFLPGFLYLGGLDPQLFTPRREAPRPSVSAGSVGIGGNQTGIYPQSSPGGWHIIGYCPVPLFNSGKRPPQLISTGDRIKFTPVSIQTLQLLEVEIKSGVYSPQKKICHVAHS